MAKLYFKIASDWEEVVRLRNEIAKLKQELKGVDSTQSPAAFKSLNTQLSASTQRMDELVTKAAHAGAVMESDFRRKIFDASQTVNGFTEKIIAQKNTIKSFEQDLRRVQEAWSNAVKNGQSTKGLENPIRLKKVILEEKDALFNLTQEQANARLSVKKLRDEYALYKNDGKNVVATNEAMAISWKKALGVIGGVAALKRLGSEIIRVRGEFQSMQTAIETMVGKDMAGQLIPQIKELAKISPLTMSDMVGAEKMMLGFNIQADDTIKYLKALSDISMGESGKFNSLTLAFSQMSATGKLMGQDLNQMINAGFNPLQVIAEKTGKSIAALKEEMSKGALSAEMVQQAFIDATSAGGKFYGMSENASKTINGQISMMQDAMDAAFNEMGEKSEGVIMSGIQATTSLIQNYETVGKVLVGLIATYGAYRTAVMLVTAAESKHTLVEIGLTNARILARKAQLALNAAMLTNPYVLLAVAVGGLITANLTLVDTTRQLKAAEDDYNKTRDEAIAKEQKLRAETDRYLSVAENNKAATEDRKDALVQLIQKYPAIFEKYKTEAEMLQNILDIHKEIDKYEKNKSVANPTNKLNDINKQISDLEKLAKQRYHGGRGLTNAENAKLEMLKNKRSELEGALKKKEADAILADLTGYSNSQIEAAIKDRERLLAKMQLKGTTKGTITGKSILSGTFTKEELEGQKKLLQAALVKPATYKQDYEKAKKDWEDAKKKLSEIEKDKSKFTSKQYEEAKQREETTEKAYKKLGGVTGSALTEQEKESDKQKKQQQKSSEELLSLRLRNQQDEINLMEEGGEKRLKQIDLDYQKELDAIRKKEQEWSKANGGKLTEEQSVQISLSYSQAEGKRDKSISEMNKEEFEAMNRYLKEYGTFQQRKDAITKEYSNKIAKAATEGDKKILQKEMEESLSSLNMDKMKQEINWELIFGDLSKVSKKSLEQVKQQLKVFKNSDEYKNMTVDQKKVIDEALNNIQSTIIDKGGLLGDLPEQLDALRIAQEELNQAQEEYNDAIKHGTDAEKEVALKKKNNAEKNVQNAEINVSKSTDKTKQNLITLADTITQLGDSSEISLSQIGSLASGLVDTFTEAGNKIGGIVGAAFSLLDAIGKQGLDGFVENVFSSVFKASTSIWDTITFGAFSKITGSGDSDKNLEKDIEYLAQSNQDLKNSLDNLSEKMDKASVADASDIYGVQRENILKQEANTRESMQRSASASSNGFLGIGGSHSTNYKINKGMSSSEWKRVSEIVGRSVQNASQFFQLSSEQMAKLAEEDTTLYSKIKSLADDGYKNAAQFMDEYIAYYKQLEELENAYNEKLTNTSFDSVRNDFKNALLDMESDAEDFADNFEKIMQNAIVESLMTKKYDKLIQAWYEEFAKAMEGDEKIDEYEQRKLQDRWNSIMNQALAERDALKDAMGWESDSESSREATAKGIATASQDSVDENNGRLTVIQGHTYGINERVDRIATGIDTIASHTVNLFCLTNIDKTMQSLLTMRNEAIAHLSDIANYTSNLVEIKEFMHSMKTGIDTLNTKGITLKR